jgi:hypothetical protein
MIPALGALAYIAVELIPEMLGSPDVQRAHRRVANRLDPEKRYRELSDYCAAADTVANRSALAEECLKVGRFDEAERHYDHILKLPLGGEAVFALRKAQAQFGRDRYAEALATLDDLQQRWPHYQSAEAHLLYARALAEAGGTREALDEYHALSGYFSRRRGAGALRPAAQARRAHQRGEGGVHRTAHSDEARATACAQHPA